MKERPILVSTPLIRPILTDLKVHTRRLIRLPEGYDLAQNATVSHRHGVWWEVRCEPWETVVVRCPFGVPGDRLWVREAWQIVTGAKAGDLGAVVRYRDMELLSVTMPAQKPMPLGLTWDCWRPSIHMPRWASRISLEVTEMRVQRIQEITEEDARAEGVCEHPAARSVVDSGMWTYRAAFRAVWDAIDPGGWDRNPWVWVVAFKRVAGVAS
jgi:hypothetical protein